MGSGASLGGHVADALACFTGTAPVQRILIIVPALLVHASADLTVKHKRNSPRIRLIATLSGAPARN